MKLQMLGNPIALVIPCHSHAARCWLSGEWHRMLHCWPQTSYTGIWRGSDSHICLALPNSYWKLWMLKAHSTPENQAWCICPATPVGCLFIYLFIFLASQRNCSTSRWREGISSYLKKSDEHCVLWETSSFPSILNCYDLSIATFSWRLFFSITQIIT